MARVDYHLWVTGLLVPCIACTSLKGPVNNEPLDVSCPKFVDSEIWRPAEIEPLEQDPDLESRYSANSLAVANAYGLIEDLREFEALRVRRSASEPTDRLRLEILLEEKKIDDVLDMASLELETTTDLIDCQGLQLAKFHTRLAEQNSKQDRKLTRSAIATGALTAVLVAGILVSGDQDLNDGDAKDWIGVAGGLAATVLAVRSSRVNRTVLIRHYENLIAAIWDGDNGSGLFPSSLWYLLNGPQVMTPPDTSIREEIIETWKTSPIMLGSQNNLDQLPVLLETEGSYDQAALLLRIDMLEEIETSIDALKVALFRLQNEMSKQP